MSIVPVEPSIRPAPQGSPSTSVAGTERHFNVNPSSQRRPAISTNRFNFDSNGSTNDVCHEANHHQASIPVNLVPSNASPNSTTTTVRTTNGYGSGDPPVIDNPMDLISLFECPVCMDFALPPIMQCQSGHIVCASCRSKLSSCPSCRGNLENIRNLAMEKLAASILFPCKYALTGCTKTFQYQTKAEHEAVCENRPYSCPCPGASCKWIGQLNEVMTHLLQGHKSITTLQGEDIVFLATDISLPGAVDWVMMQSCFGQYFMLVLEKQERTRSDHFFFALVLLIGTKKQADKFVYKLDLMTSARRLTWEATPHSIHNGVQVPITASDCLVFDSNTAELFAENGSLGINVTISRVRDSRVSSPNITIASDSCSWR